jgi:dynein heavy chain 2
LTPFLQVWKNINTGADLINKKLITEPDEDPLTSFFSLESENGLKLIRQIHNDLSVLSKVLRGVTLITNDIFELASNLMKQKTPESWLAIWEGPETPSAFMKDVIVNVTAVFAWKDAAKSGKLLTSPIQLSKLFNPPTFLNALRQMTARKSKLIH